MPLPLKESLLLFGMFFINLKSVVNYTGSLYTLAEYIIYAESWGCYLFWINYFIISVSHSLPNPEVSGVSISLIEHKIEKRLIPAPISSDTFV